MKQKPKRFAIVRHFAFPSVLSIADLRRLTVIDPHNDETIQYNSKLALTEAWSIDRYIATI